MRTFKIAGVTSLLLVSGLSGEDIKEKAAAPQSDVTTLVGEFRVTGSPGLPPGFTVGKTARWAGAPSGVLPSPGWGTIKEISGVWARIEIVAPNPLGTHWVCVPTAQLRWQIAE